MVVEAVAVRAVAVRAVAMRVMMATEFISRVRRFEVGWSLVAMTAVAMTAVMAMIAWCNIDVETFSWVKVMDRASRFEVFHWTVAMIVTVPSRADTSIESLGWVKVMYRVFGLEATSRTVTESISNIFQVIDFEVCCRVKVQALSFRSVVTGWAMAHWVVISANTFTFSRHDFELGRTMPFVKAEDHLLFWAILMILAVLTD